MRLLFIIMVTLALFASGCVKPADDASSARNIDKDRAVSLATSYAATLNWKDAYILGSPVKVIELSTCWEVYFGRLPDSQADPAFGVMRVEKETGAVNVVFQK